MPLARRSAFTLFELLVVIVILVALLAILLPILERSHAAALRADCANRERQVGLAAGHFQADFQFLPGYWMPASAANPAGATWPLTLSRFLDRKELWDAWVSKAAIPPTLYWAQLVCPANPPPTKRAHWLSYVVNCGQCGNSTNPANGVCFDLLANPPGPKVSADSFADQKGAANTLLGSENTLGIVSGNSAGWLQTTAAAALQYTGICWQPVIAPNVAQRINGDKANPDPPLPGTKLIDYARPASNHPGGVNAVFCDGHVQFIGEKIAYDVYQVLMATDPKQADFPPGSPAIGYTLRDSDY